MPDVVRPFALFVTPEADGNGHAPQVAWLGLEVDGEEAFLFRTESDGHSSFMASESAERACRLFSKVAPMEVVWLTEGPLKVRMGGPQPDADPG